MSPGQNLNFRTMQKTVTVNIFNNKKIKRENYVKLYTNHYNWGFCTPSNCWLVWTIRVCYYGAFSVASQCYLRLVYFVRLRLLFTLFVSISWELLYLWALVPFHFSVKKISFIFFLVSISPRLVFEVFVVPLKSRN